MGNITFLPRQSKMPTVTSLGSNLFLIPIPEFSPILVLWIIFILYFFVPPLTCFLLLGIFAWSQDLWPYIPLHLEVPFSSEGGGWCLKEVRVQGREQEEKHKVACTTELYCLRVFGEQSGWWLPAFMILRLASSLQSHFSPLPEIILVLLSLLSETSAFDLSPRTSEHQDL